MQKEEEERRRKEEEERLKREEEERKKREIEEEKRRRKEEKRRRKEEEARRKKEEEEYGWFLEYNRRKERGEIERIAVSIDNIYNIVFFSFCPGFPM